MRAILTALEIGYRHPDTAQTYGSEAHCGEALRRDDVFVTTRSPARTAIAAGSSSRCDQPDLIAPPGTEFSRVDKSATRESGLD